jgi:hypothetical protein
MKFYELPRILEDFQIKINYGKFSSHLLQKLEFSYITADDRYNDDFIYQLVIEYFTEKLIPHKIEVFYAGMELCRTGFIADLKIDTENYLYNLYTHDLSKFSAIEAIPYATHDFSKPNKGSIDFQIAWCHHKSKNEHHPEFWLNPNRKGEISPLPMSDIYIMEMFADWIGAGRTYGNELETWLPDNFKTFTFHPETEAKVRTIANHLNIEI